MACNAHYFRYGENYALPTEKPAKDYFRGCHFVFHSFRLYHLSYLRSSKYANLNLQTSGEHRTYIP